MAELPTVYQGYLVPNKEFLRNELTRIVTSYRNHPSWMSLALGNEFNEHRIKDKEDREQFLATIRELVELGRKLNPTRPILSNDGYLVQPTDMASLYSGYASDLPTIKHEFGTYKCSLPDIYIISKFTGVIKPLWLQSMRDWLDSNGLLENYPGYLQNSWRLLQAARKSEIESLRALQEIIGYQYHLITDFPEGTPEGAAWAWGWCDYFWNPKGITPEEGREINAAVLPLIGLKVSERSMWAEEPKSMDVFVSNYGSEPIVSGSLEWELRAEQQRLAGGRWNENVPLGGVSKVGQIQIEKVPTQEARRLDLIVSVSTPSQKHTNRWNLWAFPRKGLMQTSSLPVISLLKSGNLPRYFPFIRPLGSTDQMGQGVLISSELSVPVVKWLNKGGRVLLLAEGNRSDATADGTYFPHPFGGAQGIKIQDHPALRGFPNDGFPDLQFYNLIEGGSIFGREDLEGRFPISAPIISGIATSRGDSANISKYFSLLFEAKVGEGKLLLSTLNIRPNLDDAYPEVVFFLDRLLRYVLSSEFNPAGDMSQEEFSDLVVPYLHRVHSL